MWRGHCLNRWPYRTGENKNEASKNLKEPETAQKSRSKSLPMEGLRLIKSIKKSNDFETHYWNLKWKWEKLSDES